MSDGAAVPASGSLRIDRLLVCLRFARTRSAALALIESRAVRRNRQHVLRGSEPVRIGDVLTIALGPSVRVIEVLALPDRRGSPQAARSHYREVDGTGLDPKGQMTIAASPHLRGPKPDDTDNSHLKEP